ncbi:MAG: flippase-like domain-containing protein [Myxococcales bacterium]|nr:flippase-like domain-containing protein [Myxococcales bacterium]
MPDSDNTREPKRFNARRAIAIVLGLGVSATFLVLLLRRVDLAQVWRELSRVHVGRLLLSISSMTFGFCAQWLRSRALFAPISDLRSFRLLKSVMLGFSGNNVLPLRAGELLRIHYLAHHGKLPHSSCFALVAVERLMDLLLLVALFLSLLPLVAVDLPPTGAIIGIASVVALGLLTIIGIARWPSGFVRLVARITGWLGERISSFARRKAELFVSGTSSLRSLRALLAAFVATLGYWVMTIVTVRITLWAFGLELPWTAPMVVLVFSGFAVTLPSSPGYVGTYHYFVALALRLMGVPAARATSFAFVLHAAGIVPFTLLGVALLAPDALRGDLVPADKAAPAPTPVEERDAP